MYMHVHVTMFIHTMYTKTHIHTVLYVHTVADSRKEQEALMGLLMTVRASIAKAMLSLSVDMGDQVT